jgi:transcriptional regulator with XRE-family HTH domain
LAEVSGLSVNAISLIERGLSSPTVSSLHRLAKGLGLRIVDFFGQAAERDAVYVPAGRGCSSDVNGTEVKVLASGLNQQRLQPFQVALEPGAGIGETVSHIGQELVFGLTGTVDYRVGDSLYHVGQGDTLLFDASVQHSWANSSDQPASMLVVLEAPQGTATVPSSHMGES